MYSIFFLPSNIIFSPICHYRHFNYRWTITAALNPSPSVDPARPPQRAPLTRPQSISPFANLCRTESSSSASRIPSAVVPAGRKCGRARVQGPRWRSRPRDYVGVLWPVGERTVAQVRWCDTSTRDWRVAGPNGAVMASWVK